MASDIVAEMRTMVTYFDDLNSAEEKIEHSGTPQMYDYDPNGSGRYRQGSGANPNQHSGNLLTRDAELAAKGYSRVERAKMLGFKSTNDYLPAISNAKNEVKKANIAKVQELHAQGLNSREIYEKTGIKESTQRNYISQKTGSVISRLDHATDVLRESVDKKGYVDVGKYVENEMGCSEETKKKAISRLQDEGYNKLTIRIPQPGDTTNRTTVMVLAKPGVPKEQAHELYKNPELIQSFGDYGPRAVKDSSRKKLEPPVGIDADRVFVRYGDKGGDDKDGLIEIRRGVPDLTLGQSHYAQVRILLKEGYYLKGMAIYSDDIPEGKDIVFNTNKKSGTPAMDRDRGVFKPVKEIVDKSDNPFGAYIPADGQTHYLGKDGKMHLSAVNKLKEEGDWDLSSKSVSSQFLSKQPTDLIKRQLKLTYDDKVAEFEEIKSITNPTVRQNRLMAFANSCDSAYLDLKACSFPRQNTRVIFPVPELKDNEVYDPSHRNGEKVALIRYPHAGTFEIPILTVNNKNKAAAKELAGVTDGIGINKHVADRLSGADFDGDTVVVIPTNSRVHINSTPSLPGLKGFDPKAAYPPIRDKDGNVISKTLPKTRVQAEMGSISNLITDMTLQGAGPDEITRAVRHSMVIIDANKHKLNYKQSEIDNDIPALKKKWQGRVDPITGKTVGGATTLLSLRKHTERVPETEEPHGLTGHYDKQGNYIPGKINEVTGEINRGKETGRTYIDKRTGKETLARTEERSFNLVDDPHKLSTGTVAEEAYADYALAVRKLADSARLEYLHTPPLKYNKEAAKEYSAEVRSLNSKLDTAVRNAPRQRRAQAMADSRISAIKKEYPEYTLRENRKKLNKIRRSIYEDASIAVGADSKASKITITDNEWNAIQAGAISHTKLQTILKYTDDKEIQQRALPKTTGKLSDSKLAKLKAMESSGLYTQAEIADAIGVSVSTVSRTLRENA